MALDIHPAWEPEEGQDGQTPGDRLRYIVSGDPDPATDDADNGNVIQGYARAHVPATYGTRILQDVTRTRISAGNWMAEAVYAAPGQFTPTGEKTFTFTTTGGSQKVTYAKQHVASYKAGGSGSVTSPYDWWINPGKGADVDGTTIDAAAFDFQIGRYVSPGDMTAEYVALLYQLTDTVNSLVFTATIQGVPFTFAAGECRFKGATGSLRGYGDWEISLSFSAQPNVTDKTFGDVSGVAAKGWEHISVVSEVAAVPADDKSFVAPKVSYVLVDKLFDEDNWTGLVPA